MYRNGILLHTILCLRKDTDLSRLFPVLLGAVVVSIASPVHAQKQPLPSGKSLLQSAYSTYDKPKTIQLRITMLSKESNGTASTAEITATVENDGTGKMTRGLLSINDTTTPVGVAAKNSEQRLLNIGGESFMILPQEKKYATRKREAQRFSDFFRSMIGSFVDDKATYTVSEAKLNGKPVYQVTSSAKDGKRARITIDGETRMLRRVLVLFRDTDTITDIKIESQEQGMVIPEETFAKPGADYTLDPELTKPASEAPPPQPAPAPETPEAPALPPTPEAPPPPQPNPAPKEQ